MKYKYDLRLKPRVGMTYLIRHVGSFMGLSVIYRFDGNNYIRELSHKNVDYTPDLKKTLTQKEFKEVVEQLDIDEVTMIGIMRSG